MRRQKTVILIVSLFLLITTLSIVPAHGSTGGAITKYTVTNTGTGQLYQQVNFQTGLNSTVQPILAGDELNITFTVSTNLATGASLKLSTSMSHSSLEQMYWALHGSYAGIDSSTFNPNQNYVAFSQTSGALSMSCYGTLPASLVETQIPGVTTLYRAANPAVITLTTSDGTTLDQIVVNVIDSKISVYQTDYNTAQGKLSSLQSQGVDPAYIALYTSVLSGAKLAASQGFVDNAVTMLNALTGGSPQSLQTPIEATLFIPAVVGLAVVVVVVAFLFVRARGKSSYYSLVIEDQIKDLEGLTMRAARIDKALASNLEGLKERLQQLVGM